MCIGTPLPSPPSPSRFHLPLPCEPSEFAHTKLAEMIHLLPGFCSDLIFFCSPWGGTNEHVWVERAAKWDAGDGRMSDGTWFHVGLFSPEIGQYLALLLRFQSVVSKKVISFCLLRVMIALELWLDMCQELWYPDCSSCSRLDSKWWLAVAMLLARGWARLAWPACWIATRHEYGWLFLEWQRCHWLVGFLNQQKLIVLFLQHCRWTIKVF